MYPSCRKIFAIIPSFLFLLLSVAVSYGQVADTGNWQTVTPASGDATARQETSYILAEGKFYLIGGRGIKPVQAYDPNTNSWANKAKPPIEFHHFQATTLGGLVYVAGALTGKFPHETPVPNIYVYNPAANTWQSGSSIPQARRRGSAGVVVYKNKIYMVCGIIDGHWAGWVKWFDEYDPATGTWKTLPDAPRVRDHFQAAIINDKLYLAGGRRSSASTGQTFALTVPEVDVYDFATGEWATLTGSNIPTQRAGTASAVLGNELIIIGGESNRSAAHSETEALNVQTNSWRKLGSLKQARHGTQVVQSNNKLYIVAGSGARGGSPELSSQEVFSMSAPPTNQLPVANAGNDKTLTLPSGSTTLSGTATDPDGTIADYTWTKSSGPSQGTIVSPKSATTNLTGLIQGIYVFRLTVKDNNAPIPGTAYDEVKVTVNAASGSQLVSFTLVNSANDQDIQTLVNGATINLATLASRHVNIRANTNPGTVGSVVLSLTGAFVKSANENILPYALFGDNNGNYYNWLMPVGNYTLSGTPFSARNGTGIAGTGLTVNFTVIDQNTTSLSRKNNLLQQVNKQKLTAKVFANPGNSFFTLKITGGSDKPVSVKIFNGEGRLVEYENNTGMAKALEFGINYHPGVYYAQVIQENENLVIKFIKLKD